MRSKKTGAAASEVTAFHGLGAAWFPEHHPRETWAEYTRLMAEAGLRFSRLAEFTWDKMEPEDGRFDFAWLDEAMGHLWGHGIRVILCTPTAVPPVWACEKYPDILPVLDNGKTFGFGVRRYTCPTSPSYRRLCKRLAAALARHYARNPQVLAWQLDNELGHPFCHCARCHREFQNWCQRRFGTVHQFNDAVCTHFLGQTIQEFRQLPLPPDNNHPGIKLLYHQFVSDANLACYRPQAEALRRGGVTVPVTTNMMPTWYGYDHEEMATWLDVIAGDHYGLGDNLIFGRPFANEAFTHAYLRGMKHGGGIWFHEFQANHAPNPPLPGRIRWEVLTQVGLGTNLIDFFRFDTCPSGMERDGYGIVGVPLKPTRIYSEVKAVAAEVQRLAPALEGTVAAPAEVAVLFTFANHCEFARNHGEEEFRGAHGNGWPMHLARHYGAVVERNVPCDIVYPRDDFSRYRVIIAPGLYVLPAELGAKLTAFVRAGGTLVTTAFSGVVDENGRVWDQPVPGPLGDVCGVEVLDYGYRHSLAGETPIVSASRRLGFPKLDGCKWIDEIRPQPGTEVLARYDNRFYPALPAVTRHAFGRGQAVYVGTLLPDACMAPFYGWLLPWLALNPVMKLHPGLFVTARRGAGREILFINNPGTETRALKLSGRFQNLLTGKCVRGNVEVSGFEVLVLERKTC